MYSSEKAKTVLKKDVAYLSAGIYEDVKLVAVRFDRSIRGNYFIEFRFEKDGKTMSHTEWEPTKGTRTDEEFQSTCDNQFSRIDQILKCFYPNDEDRKFSGDSFKEFAEWIVTMLDNANKDTLLRVKIVYNNSGYTTLPKYARYTFIEPMSLFNENKSVIVKLNIDLFEKPIIADQESSNANPFQVADGTLNNMIPTQEPMSEDNPNGLPF